MSLPPSGVRSELQFDFLGGEDILEARIMKGFIHVCRGSRSENGFYFQVSGFLNNAHFELPTQYPSIIEALHAAEEWYFHNKIFPQTKN